MSGISDLKTVALDSNLFIYHFEGNDEFAPYTKKIFAKMAIGRLKAVTSIVSLLEILSLPAPPSAIARLENAFMETPSLEIVDVDKEIVSYAVKVRRNYGFRLPDCIHLATAKLHKVQVFISNDSQLKRFEGVRVFMLKELL